MNATTKVVKAKGPVLYKVLDDGRFDFSGEKSGQFEHQRYVVSAHLARIIGSHKVTAMGRIYEVGDLLRALGGLKEYLGDCDPGDAPAIGALVEVLEAHQAARGGDLEAKVKAGAVEFYDLPVLFKPDTEVCFDYDGERGGGVVVEANIEYSFFGPYLSMTVSILHNLGGVASDGRIRLRVGGFDGLKALVELPVRLATDEEKAKLAERGKKWRAWSSGAPYLRYSGQLVRASWSGDKQYRSDGRVIVDSGTFQKVDADQFRNEQYSSGLDVGGGRREKAAQEAVDVRDEDLWRTFPFMWGFSFASKLWGRLRVDGLSDIAWREDAFEKLVLPEKDKQMVKALVEHSEGAFGDIVEGKGGGCIFLLHGPPGQGKTLTAETVAETLKRPLYSISVGELGVGPDQLEARLREILDVATVWNAVLLLDEADIFLEARDEKDIVRNAMVGVFLRLLEYHQGVLFLTTNRVKQIDDAFYSRISVGLHFGAADDEKRRAIWTNLLDSAGIKGMDAKALARFELNGRQIKNVIRLSQTLAKSTGADVTEDLVQEVIALTTKFNADRA